MNAATKNIVDLVLKLVAEPLAEQQREINALRHELDHMKRELTLLKLQQRNVRKVPHE